MLIDRFLRTFDVTEVHEIHVEAPPEATYKAIRHTDLRDPIIEVLFALRELPRRIRGGGRGVPSARPHSLTFDDLTTTLGYTWVLLGEEPDVEFVIGSVGKFWQRDYGVTPVAANDFVAFDEPGYAKLALSFSVRPAVPGGSVLRYEARTATTDAVARARFGRYWRIIRWGVAIVMVRALHRIKAEAERQAAALLVGVPL